MADVQQYGQFEQQRQQHEEVQHSSYTHTDAKPTIPQLPTPYISAGFDTKQLIGEGFAANITRMTGTAQELRIEESEHQTEEARRDSEAKSRELVSLQASYEHLVEQKMEAYRKHQEADADRIRKELEKQHALDIEFRKQLVELAFENQRRQLDLETRFGKKELERERQKARLTLEQSKFHTDISARLDVTAGKQEGGPPGAIVISESEKVTPQ